MSDINNIFSIGLSALQTSMTSIEVTAQNIANVDTPGYNKKEVVLASKTTDGQFFNGVEILEIKRAYDEKLSQQIVNQQGESGNWQVKKEYLAMVEEIFNESDDLGINNDLNNFWNAWQKLSLDPNGYEERQEVVSAANQLTQTINSRSQDLQQVRKNVKTEVETVSNKINQLLQDIATLNQKINEATGSQVNELKDHLDKSVEDLSQLVNINFWEDNGQITISLNGHSLVEGPHAFSLTSSINDQDEITIHKTLEDGTLIDVTTRINGGQLKGLMELNNEILPQFQEQLDTLAFQLSTEINTKHGAGFGLDGSPGDNFFTTPIDTPIEDQEGAAQLLTLNSDIQNNTDLIAASSSSDSLNNENALTIADLLKSPIIQQGSSTLSVNAFYGTIQANIGQNSQEAQGKTDHQQLILQNLHDKKSMLCDVSLDEELANLIKFQQTYNASAKIISTADEMMSVLLNIKA